MLEKNTASQKILVFAYDTLAGQPKTGDAANITATISKDGAAVAALDDVNPVEIAGGVYVFDLTQAETNADLVAVIPVSATDGIVLDAVTARPSTLPTVVAAILVDTGTTIPAQLDSMSGATFSTSTDSLEAIRNRGDAAWEDASAGTGAITFTYTLYTNESEATGPIANASVWVTTDEAGATVVASGVTNSSGAVVFYLDSGDYYVWRQCAGYNFTNPDTETVA